MSVLRIFGFLGLYSTENIVTVASPKTTSIMNTLSAYHEEEVTQNTDTYTKSFSSFQNAEMDILLRSPMQCDVQTSDDGVHIAYPPLNLHSFGVSETEALDDFTNELSYIHAHYLHAPDETLTSYARSIKYGVLSVVKEVRRGKS